MFRNSPPELMATMQYDHDVTTLTPRHIVEAFQRAYYQVYGREAQVVHMFAEWYTVNGETVHRVTLFNEIARLSDIAKYQRAQAQQEQLYAQEQAALAQQQMQYAAPEAAVMPPPAAPQPRKPAADRSMIQRLIARLRGA